MAADAPIGIFDSGLGGLSVLGAAMRMLPREDFIYYGDSLRAPYGDKPPEIVLQYAKDVTDKLLALSCKAIVIACNTATSVAAKPLRERLTLPIIGMEPALKPAASLPGSGRILVLATRLTLSQEKFSRLMALYGHDAIAVPCPGLVELVEAGETEGARVDELLAKLLADERSQACKAVVLGCTHYVFLRRAVERFFGSKVPVVDGNEGTARQLKNRLAQTGLLRAEDGAHGRVRLMTSGDERTLLPLMERMVRIARADASGAALHEDER